MCSEHADLNLEAFELQPRVWVLIQSYCPPEEESEVRRILGSSLVEQSLELYDEAATLLEIWRQVREDTDNDLSRVSVPASLPEPPQVRERLVQEVQFFVEYLKQRGAGLQGAGGRSLAGLSSHDCEVMDYVSRNKDVGGCRSVGTGGGRRPRSAVSSRDGRDTPLRHTPSSDDGSQTSMLSDSIEPVGNQLNATDIDGVVQHLREVLEDECVQRWTDIAFLQSYLEGEVQFKEERITTTASSEPSLQELRSLGSRLEQQILRGAKLQAPPTCALPLGDGKVRLPAVPTPPPPHSGQKHKGLVTRASRVKHPPPTQSSLKTSAQLANHGRHSAGAADHSSRERSVVPPSDRECSHINRAGVSLLAGSCCPQQLVGDGNPESMQDQTRAQNSGGRLQYRAEHCNSFSKPIT